MNTHWLVMLLTETVGTRAEIDGGRRGDCKGRGSCAEMSEKQYSAADVFIHRIYTRKPIKKCLFFNLYVHIDVLVFILHPLQINRAV